MAHKPPAAHLLSSTPPPPAARQPANSRASAAHLFQVVFHHGGKVFEICPLRTRREANLAADVLTREQRRGCAPDLDPDRSLVVRGYLLANALPLQPPR